ncbi:arylamine N-acetyltransferase family protein [Ancylobacter pratisalsi]|uniref:Arylamine N-acetyltransferase n=1 Tax=Ancylobacter pratisalsi TaxID=1745854 RepID=A0A6P1YKF9_9HYPH|nr:arylamine N-acetyltransferase [Ancylobacter pratisalsi]QIB33196.1 arylamine N-acetyltransferase [Ancylobacter pratisalsi]
MLTPDHVTAGDIAHESDVSHTAAIRLTPAELDAYLARIGLGHPRAADLPTLIALHHAHVTSFTWEAIDAFMGWPISPRPHDAFAKMVEGRRGGWCYEMNGLFGAALAGLGYRVTRLCGGVRRADMGDMAIGNHLTLRVDLDQPYLAEVGLGDAILAPLPMRVGNVVQHGRAFSISQADAGWLRFHNHPHGAAPSFDFLPDYKDEATLEAVHDVLTRDAGSPFVRNLVLQRHAPGRTEGIFNHKRRIVTVAGVEERPIADAREFARLLRDVFLIEVADTDAIWERVVEIERDWLAA